MGIEPTIPEFGRAKKFHVLNEAATVISVHKLKFRKYENEVTKFDVPVLDLCPELLGSACLSLRREQKKYPVIMGSVVENCARVGLSNIFSLSSPSVPQQFPSHQQTIHLTGLVHSVS
jgi:hypothetical protein